VIVLHGAGVDHREVEACFEPVLAGATGLRRIYPDLPGMGRTVAPVELSSAEDVLEALLGFAGEVTDGAPYVLVGHSAGAYFAQAMASRSPGLVTGLALVCPLLPDLRDIPEHRVVVGSGDLGDAEFRSYFVIQDENMLDRYERFVRPAAALVDEAALERIGARWELARYDGPAYCGPTLVVAGRRDSTVGHAAAVDPPRPLPARIAGGAGRRGSRPAPRAARRPAGACQRVARPHRALRLAASPHARGLLGSGTPFGLVGCRAKRMSWAMSKVPPSRARGAVGRQPGSTLTKESGWCASSPIRTSATMRPPTGSSVWPFERPGAPGRWPGWAGCLAGTGHLEQHAPLDASVVEQSSEPVQVGQVVLGEGLRTEDGERADPDGVPRKALTW
jgi:pimeloyl-ACP methyl ester carboxylesterase